MLREINLNCQEIEKSCIEVLNVWSNDNIKVVVTKPDIEIKDVKSFYTSIFQFLGKPAFLAEDATINDRLKQRTGKIWMEIRYDPTIKNAYRHSKNAQPLHTDGSYIPNFPNSSLMCCKNNSVIGGETVFIDADLIVSILRDYDSETFNYLTSNNIIHTRSGDKYEEKVLKKTDGKWLINWNYYCIDTNETQKTKEIADKFFDFLNNNVLVKRNLLNIKLNSGEAILWKDKEVLHGRNSFEAKREGQRFIWKCAFEVGNFK
jgi:alpha-ketoglutarate-dependent taurine dioxygenase